MLRIFERGGRRPLEPGNPDPEEEPGRPKNRLSNRGLGTLNRTDPVFIGLQKTRLLDPTLNMIGTNDHPGDYRASGCTACHVIYANDESPVHSAAYAKRGNQGFTRDAGSDDPEEALGTPAEACLHAGDSDQPVHGLPHAPGDEHGGELPGLTWWDNETDGDRMYPEGAIGAATPSAPRSRRSNPEGSALRGLWSDPAFLQKTGTPEFNNSLRQTRFADFHGHGWLFRAVFKRDRKGNLLDAVGKTVPGSDARAAHRRGRLHRRALVQRASERASKTAGRSSQKRTGLPVHLKDIHLERGMHCIDCHFKQDAHGDGKLYGEPRNAIEITCVDCHGTVDSYGTLVTSGPGARRLPGRSPDGAARTQPRRRASKWRERRSARERFRRLATRIFQRSMVTPGLEWEVPQIKDSVDPTNARRYQPRVATTPSWCCSTSPACRDPVRATDPAKQARQARACRIAHDLPVVPLVVDHELLRLPSVADRQLRKSRCSTTRARSRATGHPTTSRCCATTSTCWGRTAA